MYLSFQFYKPAVHTNQARTASSSLFVTKTISVLSNRMFIKTVIIPCIYTAVTRGTNFGGGHDIYIPKNAKTSTGYTNFGHTYRPPSGYSYGNSNTQALLAGSYSFYPTELKLKFIISLKFYVRSCILLICNLRYFQVPLSYLTCI